MKKIILALAIVCAAAISQASTVKWGATATSAYNGQTMYLLTSLADSYKDEAALAAAAVDSAVVKKVGAKYSISSHEASNEAITTDSNFYLAVVVDDKIHYTDVTSTLQALVYTPPDSAKDAASVSFASVATSTSTIPLGGGGGDVPEPTSGVLLLVGVAMLALRRKQK